MDILETPLGDEINRVLDSRQGTPSYYVDAVIHTQFGDVGVIRVLNHDIVRDYTQQYSDEISITVVVPAGQYAYRISPSRNDLEMTVSNTPISEHGQTDLNPQQFGMQRFRAVLKTPTDTALETNTRELLSEFTMDVQNLEVIEFQLFGKAIEQFQMQTTGGLWRRQKVSDLIRTILLTQSTRVDVESDYKPLGVDMVESNDEQIRDHILLPPLPSFEAPGYIHKHCGGVYPAGMAYYYQDDYWYVFPPFNYKRFQESSRHLMIMIVPENKMSSVSNTFLVEGSVVTIIATGGVQLTDLSDLNKRTSGNGVRFADASRLFEEGPQVAGNKAMASRGKMNNEFISSQQKSDVNNAKMSEERITANVMYQASALAAKEGVNIQLVWQNADPALILPGMQAQIYYYKEGQVQQADAVVIGAQSATIYQGQGLVTGNFQRNVALNLFAANEANQLDNTNQTA